MLSPENKGECVVKFRIAAAMIFAAASLTVAQAAPKVLPIAPKIVKPAPHAAPAAKAKVAHVRHCRCRHIARHRHHARHRHMAQSWRAARRYAESYYDYHSASTVTWYGEAPMQGEAVTLAYPQDFSGGVGYGVDGGDYGSGVWIDGYGRRHFLTHHRFGHFRHGRTHGHPFHR